MGSRGSGTKARAASLQPASVTVCATVTHAVSSRGTAEPAAGGREPAGQSGTARGRQAGQRGQWGPRGKWCPGKDFSWEPGRREMGEKQTGESFLSTELA